MLGGDMGIGRAAHENVNRGIFQLGPCMNGYVRLRQKNDPRYTATLTKMMKLRIYNGCPGLAGRSMQSGFQHLRVFRILATKVV